ncbi:unnamed protein product [Adineta steineri]|uniref:Apple domain-containing protein n=1 Tax=Adineta steineri TaxID=433720 RepID=A0A814KD91_9BILA|nr:unnamed protein product [Adineta steineri]CAF1051061.1 unnamed protein product [Adineta steineri]
MICGIINSSHQQHDQNSTIMWNENNWALSCDFNGNDISHVITLSDDCEKKCFATSGCTHYTWNLYNGGTCWMKNNNISKADAFSTNNSNTICGIITSEKH